MKNQKQIISKTLDAALQLFQKRNQLDAVLSCESEGFDHILDSIAEVGLITLDIDIDDVRVDSYYDLFFGYCFGRLMDKDEVVKELLSLKCCECCKNCCCGK